MRHSKFFLSMMTAVACSAHAQTDGPASAALERLAQGAAEYRRDVPNFTCDENVVSTSKRGGKINLRVEFRGPIRVVRAPEGTLSEDLSVNNYMGKEMTKGGKFTLPIYVSGGLSKGLPSFFSTEEQKCYRYTLGAGRIDFQAVPAPALCTEALSTHGFATLDAAGNLLHGEMRRSPEDAWKQRLTTFSSIDYAPVQLGGKEYRMPVHLYAEQDDGNLLKTFDAHYTNCKLFKGTATIKAMEPAELDVPR